MFFFFLSTSKRGDILLSSKQISFAFVNCNGEKR
jgi:hypothetical protein